MSDITQGAQTGNESQSNRIVVGHDGSGGSDTALKMALKLADRLQASVLIVRAWSMATAPRRPDWEFGYVPSFDEMSAAVHEHLVNDIAADVARSPTCRWSTEPSTPAQQSPSSSYPATP